MDVSCLLQVCSARVKTRDTLKQHRKKLHNLLTPVPKNAEVFEGAMATPGVVMEQGAATMETTAFVETSVISTL